MIRPRVVVGTLLVAVMVWWFAPQSAEVVDANVPPPNAGQTEPKMLHALMVLPALNAKIEPFEVAAKKLFGEREQPAQATPAPVVVAAPTLPDTFQLVGKAQIDGAWKAIIAVDGKSYLAGTGDKVADRFVVEKLTPPWLVILDVSQNSARFELAIGDAP